MSERYRIVIYNQALADLEATFSYIAQSSAQTARGAIRRILDSIDELESMPHDATALPHESQTGHAVHRMGVRPFLVYYAVDDRRAVVTIFTVRHGARRQPKKFP